MGSVQLQQVWIFDAMQAGNSALKSFVCVSVRASAKKISNFG